MTKNLAERMQNKAKSGSGSSSKDIPVQELAVAKLLREEPFVSLFQIRQNTLAAIKADIEKKGFDLSKPVNVWGRKGEDGGLDYVLIDGFTRVAACEQLSLLTVTAYVNDFADKDAALEYAIHQQRDRRNLTDAEILTFIEAVDKPVEGFKTALASEDATLDAKKTSEITAAKAGTNASKIEKGRAVLKHPAIAKKVKSGRLSINRGYSQARKLEGKIDKARPSRPSNTLSVNLTLSEAEQLIAFTVSHDPNAGIRKIVDKLRKARRAAARKAS